MPRDTHIKDAEELQQKIHTFRKAGSASFHVVSDFDRTLTTAFVQGKKFQSYFQ